MQLKENQFVVPMLYPIKKPFKEKSLKGLVCTGGETRTLTPRGTRS